LGPAGGHNIGGRAGGGGKTGGVPRWWGRRQRFSGRGMGYRYRGGREKTRLGTCTGWFGGAGPKNPPRSVPCVTPVERLTQICWGGGGAGKLGTFTQIVFGFPPAREAAGSLSKRDRGAGGRTEPTNPACQGGAGTRGCGGGGGGGGGGGQTEGKKRGGDPAGSRGKKGKLGLPTKRKGKSVGGHRRAPNLDGWVRENPSGGGKKKRGVKNLGGGRGWGLLGTQAGGKRGGAPVSEGDYKATPFRKAILHKGPPFHCWAPGGGSGTGGPRGGVASARGTGLRTGAGGGDRPVPPRAFPRGGPGAQPGLFFSGGGARGPGKGKGLAGGGRWKGWIEEGRGRPGPGGGSTGGGPGRAGGLFWIFQGRGPNNTVARDFSRSPFPHRTLMRGGVWGTGGGGVWWQGPTGVGGRVQVPGRGLPNGGGGGGGGGPGNRIQKRRGAGEIQRAVQGGGS